MVSVLSCESSHIPTMRYPHKKINAANFHFSFALAGLLRLSLLNCTKIEVKSILHNFRENINLTTPAGFWR